jgi:hypothetical protein
MLDPNVICVLVAVRVALFVVFFVVKRRHYQSKYTTQTAPPPRRRTRLKHSDRLARGVIEGKKELTYWRSSLILFLESLLMKL